MNNILTSKWLTICTNNISFNYLFDKLNIKNIIIEQDDIFSNNLFNQLNNSGSYNIVMLKDLGNIKYDNSSTAIIITNYNRYYHIYNKYSNLFYVFSIKELINFTYDLFIEYKRIRNTYKNQKIFLIRLPLFRYELNPSNSYESILQTLPYNREKLQTNPAYFQELYSDIDEYSDEYIHNIYSEIPIIEQKITIKDKVEETITYYKHIDFKSKYVNIINGTRYTHYQNQNAISNIHIFGNCFAFGIGTDDKHTIASQLQQLTDNYIVHNHGVWNGNADCIFAKDIEDNDIIIIITLSVHLPTKQKKYLYDICKTELQNIGIVYDELTQLFEKNIKYYFTDSTHINHRGYSKIAEYINTQYISKIKPIESNINSNKNKSVSRNIIQSDLSIDTYLNYLKSEKLAYSDNGVVGAIVMNCNPFTNGHRYLIEYASKQVDYLYIFVVEEDKSFFPFKDRFMLIQKGTNDLNNVKVIRSGAFIISTTTFPEYFSKDSIKNTTIDPSTDINTFGQYIAPVLNIQVRFAGSEPLCNVTNTYNNYMRKLLPKYSIEFHEIPRLQYNNNDISASFVRQLLGKIMQNTPNQIRGGLTTNNNLLLELSKLVPEHTYEYLLKYIEDKGVVHE